MGPVELLDPGCHDCQIFASGVGELDDWLRHTAEVAAAAGTAATWVLCRGSRIVGYYALAMGSVDHRSAPSRLRRGQPDHPIPVLLLAGLALDRSEQGHGLGADLLQDALIRAVAGARHYGARAVIVDAINDRAVAFYARHGFLPLAAGASTGASPILTVLCRGDRVSSGMDADRRATASRPTRSLADHPVAPSAGRRLGVAPPAASDAAHVATSRCRQEPGAVVGPHQEDAGCHTPSVRSQGWRSSASGVGPTGTCSGSRRPIFVSCTSPSCRRSRRLRCWRRRSTSIRCGSRSTPLGGTSRSTMTPSSGPSGRSSGGACSKRPRTTAPSTRPRRSSSARTSMSLTGRGEAAIGGVLHALESLRRAIGLQPAVLDAIGDALGDIASLLGASGDDVAARIHLRLADVESHLSSLVHNVRQFKRPPPAPAPGRCDR